MATSTNREPGDTHVLRQLCCSIGLGLLLLSIGSTAYAENLEGSDFTLQVPPGFEAQPINDCGG